MSGAGNATKVRARSELVFLLVMFALAALVILYPETIIHQRVIVFGITLTPLTVMMPVTFLAFAWYAPPRLRELEIKPLDALFALALAYTLIRALAAAEAAIELRLALEYTGYAAIAYYGNALVLSREANRVLFMRFMAVMLLIVSAYEVLTFIIESDPIYGGALSRHVPVESARFYRGGSTLGQPVHLGGYLLIAMPFAFWGALMEESRKWRHFFAACSAISVVALLLSFSRGAIAAAAVLGAAVLLGRSWMVRRKLIIVIAGLALALAAILAARGDLTFQLIERDDSFQAREWQWSYAVEAIRDHPVFGVGLFKSIPEVNRYNTLASGKKYPVDNSYLTAAVEQGLAGAALYGAVMLLLFWGLLRLLQRAPPGMKAKVIAALLSLAGISINALLFDAFVIWPHFILFWTVAGFARSLESG